MEPNDPDSAARLFVTAPLSPEALVPLDGDQVHYLRVVLRLQPGGALSLFNGRDGDWQGIIEILGKNSGAVRLIRQTRPQQSEPDIWLLFAPVKRTRIDYLVEKATELGVSALLPVFTRRTNVGRVNLDRLGAHAREAAEQTGRLSVPIVEAPQSLDQALARYPRDRRLFVCDETGTAPDFAGVLLGCQPRPIKAALLIGPEGGFAPEELDALKELPFVSAVGLGPRVLRADTAALAALTVFQALAGDWGG